MLGNAKSLQIKRSQMIKKKNAVKIEKEDRRIEDIDSQRRRVTVEDSPTRGMHIRNTLHISLNQKNIRTNSDINELSEMFRR
jgi:hypothetical protein